MSVTRIILGAALAAALLAGPIAHDASAGGRGGGFFSFWKPFWPKPNRPKSGTFSSELEVDYIAYAASHFVAAGGDGANAGTEGTSSGKSDDFGKIEVLASTSWDWSGYSSAHACALMNTIPHDFTNSAVEDPEGVNGGPFFPASFTATAEYVIKKLGRHGDDTGDSLEGLVRGGSVCEIAQFDPLDCTSGSGITTNEGLVAFDIVGGTGRYEDAVGHGVHHTIFNYCTNEFELNTITFTFEFDD